MIFVATLIWTNVYFLLMLYFEWFRDGWLKSIDIERFSWMDQIRIIHLEIQVALWSPTLNSEQKISSSVLKYSSISQASLLFGGLLETDI